MNGSPCNSLASSSMNSPIADRIGCKIPGECVDGRRELFLNAVESYYTCQEACLLSETCAYFTHFAEGRCHGYSSCGALDDARCFGACFSGDQVCTAEEECVRPGRCENTAVVDARPEATLMDCARFMNRRPDANYFSYDVETLVMKR